MIKIRKFLLVLLLFLFVFSVNELVKASESTITLQASEVSISQGESGYVSFTLGGDVDISMLSFAIFYDAEYLDVGYVKSDTYDEFLTIDYVEDGVIEVRYDGEDIVSEGLLFEVFFNVEVEAPTGLYLIDFVVEEVRNTLDEVIDITSLTGHITVEANEIVIEEITFYSRVSDSEGDFPILTYEVYADDLKGLTSFEGTVSFDPAHFFVFDASIGEQLSDHVAHGEINAGGEDSVYFNFAFNGPISSDEPLLQVRFEVTNLEAFTSSITFEASNLVNDELREITANTTSKEVKLDEGYIVTDYPNMTVTNYGGSQNQTFDLYVNIEEGSMLASGDFLLTYDEAMLEVVRVQVGHNVINKGGVLFFEDDVYDGDISFSYFHESGLTASDTLLIVTMKAAPDTILDSSVITIEGLRTTNHQYAEIDLDYVNGTVDFYTAFLVKFLDYNNNVLSSTVYEENQEIIEPSVPLRENTVFKEWSESFDLATKNQTMKAIYELVEEEIVMDNLTVTYNGGVHSLEVVGLPVGGTAIYHNNEYQNVGEYQVTADIYLDGVFQFTLEGTLAITPKPITVTVGSHERVYDSVGSIAYTVNGKVSGDDLEIEVFTNDGYDVGVHALSAVVHNENYVATIVDGTLVITKATYDMSMIEFTPMTYTRGNNTYYVEISGTLPEGVSVTYINNGKSEIGSYTVTAEFYGDYQNYEEIESMTTILTIDSPTILGPSFVDKTVTYDGTMKYLEVMNIPSGATVTYDVGNGYRNAGEYRVEATISKDGYEDMTLVATLYIEKATYNMSDITFVDQSFEFNGEQYSIFIDGTLPSGVEVSYLGNSQGNVGDYEVIAHFTSDNPNYQMIPSMSATLSVLDNPYVDIVFEDQTVTYNGEEYLIELDNVPLEATVLYLPGNGFTDAGVYEVTAEISLDGYDDYIMQATLTIEKQVLVIRADNKASIYGEDLLELTYTVEGFIYNEEVDIDINKEGNDDAGTYAIVLDADHENYDITLFNATYTIEKATYDMSGITLNHSRVVYDGEDHSIVINGDLPAGVDVEYLNNQQIDVGIYTITATFTSDDENYYQIPSKQARLIIEPALMEDLVFDSLAVEYDGEIHSIVVDNLPVGATVVYLPSNSFVASGVYEVTAVVSLEGYLDETLTATLTINGLDIDTGDIMFYNETYQYDDQLKTLLIDGSLPEGVIGVDYLNHRRTEAGSQIVLLKVFVEAGYNPVPNMVAILTVDRAPIEGITFTGGNYVYDGTEKTFSLSGHIAQFGHELDVEYSQDLSYINAGSYTVRVTLSHPNYQTLVIEETMVIEKATRTIQNNEFELTVLDDQIQIERDTLADLIYYSVDNGPFVYGTTIPFLEEDSWYSIRIYLGETLNYNRSNIVLFNEKTYLSSSTVESMIEAIEEVDLTSRDDIMDIMEKIDLLLPSEKDAQILALDQVIQEYDALIESYRYEYKLGGDVVEKIFPLELLLVNYQLATLEEIKRRDLI